MKIKKLVPEEIKDKKLEYKIYRKIIKPALKAMMSMHLSEEATTGFIVKTDYEFADMKGKKMGLIIPGDQTAAWGKMAKEELKTDKKHTCIGQCYVKESTDGPILVLMPEKGAAKKNLMLKQLQKFALKGTPFKIEISAGGELEEDNPADAVVDEVEEEEVAEEEEVEAPKTAAEEQAVAQEVATMMKAIATTFKDRIKGFVLPRLKAGDPEVAQVDEVDGLLDKLEEMQELYSSASDAIQNKLKDNALKIFGLVPTLEKIKHAINKKIGAEPEDDKTEVTTDAVETAAEVASNAAEAVKINIKLMNEINAIADELDIFALA
jgi:hypothetical protein